MCPGSNQKITATERGPTWQEGLPVRHLELTLSPRYPRSLLFSLYKSLSSFIDACFVRFTLSTFAWGAPLYPVNRMHSLSLSSFKAPREKEPQKIQSRKFFLWLTEIVRIRTFSKYQIRKPRHATWKENFQIYFHN
jgi:hypothetical protein